MKRQKLTPLEGLGTPLALRNVMSRSMPIRRRSRDAGFTLLEVLIIVVVFLVIAAIVGPLTVKMLVRLRIEGFADQVGAMVQATRSQAVRENKIYGILWDGDSIVRLGPFLEIDDWTLQTDWEDDETGIGISAAAEGLAAGDHGLARYTAATCLDHDGDGASDVDDPPLFFDGLGAPLVVAAGGRLQSGQVAFCFGDPPRAASGKANVMQVRVDSTAGVVRVAKLIDDAGAVSGVRFADETERFDWEWY